MKILKFAAQNIKGIKVVEIKPDGEVVTLSGKNGQGKSSVLDAIDKTMTGGKLAIRNGQEKGEVEIDLGEYIIKRTITEKNDRLVVKNKDGALYPSPRDFLSKFVGEISIDPLAFIKLKDRDQVELLYKMAPGLQEKLTAFDQRITNIKEDRSIILRDGKQADFKISECVGLYQDVPEEEVSVSELIKQLNNAREGNIQLKETHNFISISKKNVEILKEDVEQHKREIESIEARITDTLATYITKEQSIKGQLEINTSVLEEKIDNTEETNKKVRQNQEFKKLKAEREDLRTQYAEKGKELEATENEKGNELNNQDFPIKGLSIFENTVFLSNVPMSDLSNAEKIKIGSAIAVAQNPKAKIILVDDVSLLDSENMTVLHETCAGFQLWQVVNDESGEEGFFIEDGTITNQLTTV